MPAKYSVAMTAVLLFVVGMSLGFFLPWPRTLLLALLVPLYYLGEHLGTWGEGPGDQWIWAMTFLTVTVFASVAIGIMLGGGTKLLDRQLFSRSKL